SITVSAEDVEGLSDLVTEVRIAENARTAAAAQIVARRLGADGDRLDRRLRFDRSAFLFADVRQALAQFADFSAGTGLSQCGGGGLRIRAGPVELGLLHFERLLRR